MENETEKDSKLDARKITELPEHILEKILSSVDGVTLARCRRVSKQFKERVEELSTKKSIWFKCCKEEIEPDTFLSLVPEYVQRIVLRAGQGYGTQGQHSNPWSWYRLTVPKSGHPIVEGAVVDEDDYDPTHVYDGSIPFKPFSFNWELLYMKWCRNLCKTRTSEWETDEVDGFEKESEGGAVTVVRVSGQLVITGHAEGSIFISDPEAGTLELANLHDQYVTDIALINLYDFGRYYTYEPINRQNDAPLPYSHHHHIVSVGHDSCIRICPMKSTLHAPKITRKYMDLERGGLYAIKVFGDQFLVSRQRVEVTWWQLDYDRHSFDPNFPIFFHQIRRFTAEYHSPFDFHFWNGTRFSFYGTGGMLCIHNTLTEEHENSSIFEDLPYPPNRIYFQGHLFKRIYMFQRKFFFLLTVENLLFYSIDGTPAKLLPQPPNFSSGVSSMALKGSLIAFGLESGLLYMYNLTDWSRLDILDKLTPSYVDNDFDGQAIVSIDINDDDESPVVVAASGDKYIRVRCKSESEDENSSLDSDYLEKLLALFKVVALKAN